MVVSLLPRTDFSNFVQNSKFIKKKQGSNEGRRLNNILDFYKRFFDQSTLLKKNCLDPNSWVLHFSPNVTREVISCENFMVTIPNLNQIIKFRNKNNFFKK